MTTIYTPTEVRTNLYKLIDQVNIAHKPIYIHGQRKNAVLVSEEDWQAIQETMYLLSIPGMKKSIRNGLKLKVAECVEELKW